MKYLIPIPHIDNIPPYEDRDVFCQMLDDIFGGVYNDVVGLNFLNDPLRCPAVFLDAFIEVVNGETDQTDSEAIKRVKAYNAQNGDFKKSLWKSVKNFIDGITGGDARVYDNAVEDYVWQSDSDIIKDGRVIITQWLSDYGGYNYGPVLYSDDTKYVTKFQMCIDTGIVLTQEEINRVAGIAEKQLPAYISFLIGYFNGSDFIIYKQIF
jgi:hypothetical protein